MKGKFSSGTKTPEQPKKKEWALVMQIAISMTRFSCLSRV